MTYSTINIAVKVRFQRVNLDGAAVVRSSRPPRSPSGFVRREGTGWRTTPSWSEPGSFEGGRASLFVNPLKDGREGRSGVDVETVSPEVTTNGVEPTD